MTDHDNALLYGGLPREVPLGRITLYVFFTLGIANFALPVRQISARARAWLSVMAHRAW